MEPRLTSHEGSVGMSQNTHTTVSTDLIHSLYERLQPSDITLTVAVQKRQDLCCCKVSTFDPWSNKTCNSWEKKEEASAGSGLGMRLHRMEVGVQLEQTIMLQEFYNKELCLVYYLLLHCSWVLSLWEVWQEEHHHQLQKKYYHYQTICTT